MILALFLRVPAADGPPSCYSALVGRQFPNETSCMIARRGAIQSAVDADPNPRVHGWAFCYPAPPKEGEGE